MSQFAPSSKPVEVLKPATKNKNKTIYYTSSKNKTGTKNDQDSASKLSALSDLSKSLTCIGSKKSFNNNMIKDLQPNKDKICRMTRNESNFTSDYNNSDLQTVIIYFLT